MITHCHTVLGVRRLTHMKAPEPRLIAWGHGSSHAEASRSLCDSGLWFCLLGQRSPGSSRHLLRDFPGYSLCRLYSYMFNFSIEMRNKHKPSRDREGSGPGRSAEGSRCPWLIIDVTTWLPGDSLQSRWVSALLLEHAVNPVLTPAGERVRGVSTRVPIPPRGSPAPWNTLRVCFKTCKVFPLNAP